MITTVEQLRSETNTRRETPLPVTTSLPHMDNVDTPMGLDHLECEIYRRCRTQDWGSTFSAVVGCGEKGRGLVTLQRIQKDDIVVDYHGKVRIYYTHNYSQIRPVHVHNNHITFSYNILQFLHICRKRIYLLCALGGFQHYVGEVL